MKGILRKAGIIGLLFLAPAFASRARAQEGVPSSRIRLGLDERVGFYAFHAQEPFQYHLLAAERRDKEVIFTPGIAFYSGNPKIGYNIQLFKTFEKGAKPFVQLGLAKEVKGKTAAFELSHDGEKWIKEFAASIGLPKDSSFTFSTDFKELRLGASKLFQLKGTKIPLFVLAGSKQEGKQLKRIGFSVERGRYAFDVSAESGKNLKAAFYKGWISKSGRTKFLGLQLMPKKKTAQVIFHIGPKPRQQIARRR